MFPEAVLLVTFFLLVPALLLGIAFGVLVRSHPGLDPASARPSSAVAHNIAGSRRARFASRFDPATATGLLLSLSLIVIVAGGVVLAAVVIGQTLMSAEIKNLVDRVRPTANPIAHTLGPSFPSGHTTGAAACFAAFALVLGRGRSRNTQAVLAGAAVFIAVAVAASRVLLGVHWLTDVLGGLALGWAWFALCSIAFGGRPLRLGA